MVLAEESLAEESDPEIFSEEASSTVHHVYDLAVGRVEEFVGTGQGLWETKKRFKVKFQMAFLAIAIGSVHRRLFITKRGGHITQEGFDEESFNFAHTSRLSSYTATPDMASSICCSRL